MALGGNELELGVQDVVTSLLEGIYDAANENVEKEDVSVSLADEKDVWEVGVGVHGSNAAVLLTDVLTQFGGHPVLAETKHQHLSPSSVVVLFLDIFLETSSEMGVYAVPANVAARIAVSLSTTLLRFAIHHQGRQQLGPITFQLPKAAPAVLCPRRPQQVILVELHLDYFFVVSLHWQETGQRKFLPGLVQLYCRE